MVNFLKPSKILKDTPITIFFTFFLAIILLRSYTSICVMNSEDIHTIMETFKLNKYIILIISIIFNLIIMLFTVNIMYFIISIFVTMVEHIKFEKKNLKNNIYISYMIPLTINYIIQLIYMLIKKESIATQYIHIGSILVNIIIGISIFIILKNNIKTKKTQIYLPIILFIINSAVNIKYFI